jgi:hypothetical protein
MWSQNKTFPNKIFQNTGLGKSRFTVVRMEKDVQVMIITRPKIDKS